MIRDPVSGLDYFIDARTKERVYKLPACRRCHLSRWSSVPSTEPDCVFCILGVGKVATNENTAVIAGLVPAIPTANSNTPAPDPSVDDARPSA